MPYSEAQPRLIDHLLRLEANLKAGGHAEAARFMFDVGGRSPSSRFATCSEWYDEVERVMEVILRRCALPDALKAEVE